MFKGLELYVSHRKLKKRCFFFGVTCPIFQHTSHKKVFHRFFCPYTGIANCPQITLKDSITAHLKYILDPEAYVDIIKICNNNNVDAHSDIHGLLHFWMLYM